MDYQQKRIIRDLVQNLGYDIRNHYESISKETILNQLQQIEEIERTQISHIWCVEDVQSAAEELGITLTEDQACEVLGIVEDEIDSEIGVNWNVIRSAVQWYVRN